MKHLKKYISLFIFNFVFILAFSQSKPYDTTGYTTLTGNKDISGNNQYIIPSGGSWSGGITVKNNETLSLIVEGTATVSWVDLKANSDFKIIVGTSGIINYSTFSSETYYTLTNYSTSFTLSNIGGTLINHGTITGNPSFQVYSKGTLENYGTVNTTNLEVTEMLKNYGTINVSGQLQVDNTATLDNSCKIIVKGNLIIDNSLIMRESSFMEVQLKTTFYSSSSMTFEEDAYLKTKDVWTWGHKVTGPSSGHALLQYFGNLEGSMPKFSDYNIYFVDSRGYQDGTPISYSITADDCNPGFGVVSDDPDGDGIPNDQDEFDDDPERAFISYYPSDAGTWNTLMFEDMWPKLGDYDFNDLVIKYQYEYYLNADNKVVDLIAHFQVVASGADFSNGFGFKLDIPNSSVLGVDGYIHTGSLIKLNPNNTEQGASDEAVIIVYDNLKQSVGTMFNVTHQGTPKTIDPISVHVLLNKVDQSLVSIVNPFIFTDQTRGREVHLMGFTPTSKANNSYFGTDDDSSLGGKYYRSSQNFPWALDIPSDVRHMLEYIDFSIGYPDFVKWAESGGKEYLTWYRTNLYTPVLY
ncbi:MAG: LruC domain-containing protein [Mangrovibacterium sp.]